MVTIAAGLVLEDYSEPTEHYQDYLQSDHWKNLKKRIVKKRKRCEKCESEKNLQIHHINYKTEAGGSIWYLEQDKDVMLLCDKCHKQKHHDCRRSTERIQEGSREVC